ncbi:cold shock domain-containing protein, partial [Vibrio ouci]
MKGKIVRWIDERGFGFINSDDYQGDVFVHISKFTKGYRR